MAVENMEIAYYLCVWFIENTNSGVHHMLQYVGNYGGGILCSGVVTEHLSGQLDGDEGQYSGGGHKNDVGDGLDEL